MTREIGVKITTYDRLMRAWENSMELTRDFQMYAESIEDSGIKQMFKEFAEDEGLHASKFREMLEEYRDKHGDRFTE